MKSDAYEKIKQSYLDKKELIKSRLREFKDVFKKGDDRRIFEELVFCILTAGASAKMGLKSVDAVRDILIEGSEDGIYSRLKHIHMYPGRANYIVHTREYLKREYDFKLKELISSFQDSIERRDFFATNKDIKGLGYKEASHFLRNIGFSGYAILDKHILRSLYEFGVIDNPKPPSTKRKYIEIENRLKGFAKEIGIDFDELDLLLWSEKTGEILK
ncbi:MAG: DNA lyase [Candidatus Dadabacteria bacterium]